MQKIELAISYAKKGWKVFPCKQDKKPYISGWPAVASNDIEKVKELFQRFPNANIGIVTGAASGFWVLDIDVKHDAGGDDTLHELERLNGELPATVTSVTWSKGQHLFFKYDRPISNTQGTLKGIDVRGDGGYIIAPGSYYKGEDGEGDYVWEIEHHIDNVPIQNAPEWLYKILKSKPKIEKKVTRVVNEGGRDEALFKQISDFKRYGFDYDQTLEAARAYNRTRLVPPIDDETLVYKVNRAYEDFQGASERENILWSLPDYIKIERVCQTLNVRSGFFRDLSGGIVRVNQYRKEMEKVSPEAMLTELSRFIRFTKETKQGDVLEVRANKLFTEQVMAAQELKLRVLEAVTNVPRVSHDGTICSQEGYNIHDRSYYIKTFNIPDMAIEDALGLIDEFLCDFAFADKGEGKDKTNILSLLFAPPMSNIIRNFPLHAVSANQARTGKSLLVESIMLVYNQIGATDWSANDDEMKKKITAALMGGPMFMYFDNVKTRIQNSAIEACLTTGVYVDRILGKSQMVRIPAQAIWVCTGNNLEFGSEMIKRSVCSELNAHSGDPETRAGFKHESIKLWVSQERERLLGAVYSVIKAWVKAGMPKSNDRLGGFEAYALNMGGILSFIGRKEFMKQPNDSIEDTERSLEDNFMSIWWENKSSIEQGKGWCNAKDLLEVAEKTDFYFKKTDEQSKAQSVGYFLKRVSKRHNSTWLLVRETGTRDGTKFILSRRDCTDARPF